MAILCFDTSFFQSGSAGERLKKKGWAPRKQQKTGENTRKYKEIQWKYEGNAKDTQRKHEGNMKEI